MGLSDGFEVLFPQEGYPLLVKTSSNKRSLTKTAFQASLNGNVYKILMSIFMNEMFPNFLLSYFDYTDVISTNELQVVLKGNILCIVSDHNTTLHVL